MGSIAVPGDAAGLGLVDDLEEIVLADHGAGGGDGLPELVPDEVDAGGHLVAVGESLPVEGLALLRRHDAEGIEEELAHALIGVRRVLLLLLLEEGAEQVLVEDLVIGVQGHGGAADALDLLPEPPGLQQGHQAGDGLQVKAVVVGIHRVDPGLAAELGQEVPPVEGQSPAQELQLLPGLLTGESVPAEGLEGLGIQGEAEVGIPAVGPVLPDDEVPVPEGVQLTHHAAQAVEHGLQGVGGVGAALLPLPEQGHQLLLGDGLAPAGGHVGQQQPDLPGAVIGIPDLLPLTAEGHGAQHLDFDLDGGQDDPLLKAQPAGYRFSGRRQNSIERHAKEYHALPEKTRGKTKKGTEISKK